ncbi:MAG TPA: hypothetical protein PLW68_14475 [Casimicrobiaceae bacterium]|nr:hypothetical protein [Casimicrobiaceae bacterium]
MAILNIFDTKELEEFATTLALDLGRRFPPASEARTDAGVEHQVKVILEGLTVRAVRFHELHKLGVYKKAKLANVFKWKLAELGYSEAFIDRATKQLVTRLAVK